MKEMVNVQKAGLPTSVPAIEQPPKNINSILSLGILADRYLKTPSIAYDHAYGLKPVEGSINFRLGRMDVRIKGNDFEIDDKTYNGTEGLWKLLTLKHPGDVLPEDFEIYKDIMLQTKGFLMEGSDKVKCNRGEK
jgi:hypothetical protein